MTPLQKTIRDQNRLAALFVKAAVEMDNPEHNCGCCSALAEAQRLTEYASPAHDAFLDAFPWEDEGALAPWQTGESEFSDDFECYPEDARQARVLALLFCAEMARLGEIG